MGISISKSSRGLDGVSDDDRDPAESPFLQMNLVEPFNFVGVASEPLA